MPLVRRAALAASSAGASPVVVVIGADAALVAPVLSGIAGVMTVVNDDWQSGIASSIKTGLRAICDDEAVDGVIITLADQPHVDTTILSDLLAGFDNENRIVAAAYQNTMGVPVVFGRELFGELMGLSGDNGAGHWLRRHSSEVRRIPLGDAATDIDTPSDAFLRG